MSDGDTGVLQNLLGLEEDVIAAGQKTKDSQKYYWYNKDIQGSTTSPLVPDIMTRKMDGS